jgi:hypothetical protein
MTLTLPLASILAGDLIEVTKGEEAVRARVVLYAGLLYLGKTGRSLNYYAREEYDFRTIEHAEPSLDKATVTHIGEWLRKEDRTIWAGFLDAFGGESDDH